MSFSILLILCFCPLYNSWLLPVSLPIYESRYLQLHVGRPGKDMYFAFDFNQNITQVAFYPWLYSNTYVAEDSSEIFYFGPMPIRLTVTSSTESIIGMGAGSPFWKAWKNITISPREMVLGGANTTFGRLAITRCGSSLPTASGVSIVPQTSLTYLPAVFYDMPEFPMTLGSCNVTIRAIDSTIYTDTGHAMDMRRETTCSSIILGLPVILRHFVYFRDYHSGTELVGISAEETEVNYWVLATSIVLTILISATALISITKPHTNSRSVLNVVCIVLCGAAALVVAVHPSTMDIARLRFSSTVATVPGVALPLVLVCLVTVFWAVPWMISAGFASLWLVSLWDMGDYVGILYRLFWGIILTDWQCTLTIVRKFQANDSMLAIGTVLFTITYVLYPTCVQFFGAAPYVATLGTIIFSIGLILVPVQLLSLFYWLRQKKGNAFADDVFIPIN